MITPKPLAPDCPNHCPTVDVVDGIEEYVFCPVCTGYIDHLVQEENTLQMLREGKINPSLSE